MSEAERRQNMNIRKNRGITIVALVVSIIILLIIAGVSISGTIIGVKETEATAQMSELTMIQHAILERYTSSIYTKQELPGTTIQISEVEIIIDEINELCDSNITLKGTEYKRLTKQDLNNLGIKNEEYTYIVNYKTGEVINESIKATESKEPLYIYSREE